MKLSALDHETEFALLAPGFTGAAGWTLVRFEGPPDCTLWFATAEGRPVSRRGRALAIELELDVAPRALDPVVDADDFHQQVEGIRERIAAGDVYQVNYTVRARFTGATGAEVLATLCRRGPPRFGCWVKTKAWGEFVSASPELLVACEGRSVRVEPMKGTAAPEARAWLLASEKDRAELAMITDLLRDDLHRLCARGTVRVVNERRVIELPYVVQTVADVEGQLRDGVAFSDVLAQVHPGGSVTGAPRPAALEEISRREPTPRGPYCGLLGLERGDRLVAALLIRTAARANNGWVYGVGNGITWDSQPDAEWQELQLKLGALR